MEVEILKQNGHNFLWIDKELWMWDVYQEDKIQKGLAEQASGDVLVVGYGLGLVHKHLLENKKVSSITTIEKYEEVIEACKSAGLPIIGGVMIGDFLLEKGESTFDCVIGDIWTDIVPSELNTYKAFKNKALEYVPKSGIVDDKILAWGKDYFEYLINKKW